MPRVKRLRGGRVVTNALGTAAASKPQGYSSFIQFYRAATHFPDPPCYVLGCPNRGAHGGHVKLARSAVTSLLAFDWFIVPACHGHNKRSSCGSYAVKPGTLAVRLRPSLGERIASYPADAKKLVAALMGKHHL
jgi:hypothetical protein